MVLMEYFSRLILYNGALGLFLKYGAAMWSWMR